MTDHTPKNDTRLAWEVGVNDGIAVVAGILQREGHPDLADQIRWRGIRWRGIRWQRENEQRREQQQT